MSLIRSLSRAASLAIAVTGALAAVAMSSIVQACSGDSATKEGGTPQDAAPDGPAGAGGSDGSAGAAGAAGEAGAAGGAGSAEAGVDDASPDGMLILDAPEEVDPGDVVPQDDVSLDVVPAE